MTSSTPASLRVIIIGAGTGGLALAHALIQAGINVRVFERDRTKQNERGGYRVGISPAGSRALKACVPASVYDLFVATSARPPRTFNMLTENFEELLCMTFDTDAMDGEHNVIRQTLRRVLLTGLSEHVTFDKTFIGYDSNPDASVTVRFEDGSWETGDVLIGADGAGSHVRRQRLPQARHEDTGIVSLGGRLPMTDESKALLTDKMFYGMSMIMAPKGFGAIIHSLEFTPNRADPDFMARWPEFESSIADDSIGWGLWAARQNLPCDPATLDAQELLQLAQELTRTWHLHLQQLIRMTDPSTMQTIAIRTSVPPSPWESSNVTLLGDAVHTMTPGRGAGANTALRDAQLLCKKLVDVRDGRMPLIEAIHAYEAEMLRYSSEAVIESRKNMNAGDAIHKPFVGRLQLAAMRTAMRVVNAVPPLNRRITRNIMRVRGAN